MSAGAVGLQTRSTRRRKALAGVVVLSCSAVLLAGCSDDGSSPLGSTQWQVTQVFDGSERNGLLPEPQQGRSYVVFGEDALTGASGCLSLSGDVEWLEGDTQMRVTNFRTEPLQTGSSEAGGNSGDGGGGVAASGCLPGDEDTAERLGKVFGGEALKISRPENNSMKLQQIIPDLPEWDTAPSVEFISGP